MLLGWGHPYVVKRTELEACAFKYGFAPDLTCRPRGPRIIFVRGCTASRIATGDEHAARVETES